MKANKLPLFLALAIAIVGAFAFKSAPRFAHIYGVQPNNAASSTFTLIEMVDGQSQPGDYVCDESDADDKCTVSSETLYTLPITLPKTSVTPVIDGNFDTTP